MIFQDPVISLKGIGEKSALKLSKAGIVTLGDMLSFYPVRYEKYCEPGIIADKADGQIMAVCGFLEKQPGVRRTGKMIITAGTISSETERIPVSWFNMPYLRGSLIPGRKYVFRGRVKVRGNVHSLQQPQVFLPEDYEEKCRNLQPVYPLPSGLTLNLLRRSVRQILEKMPEEEDWFPEFFRKEYDLMPLRSALTQIHFPDSDETLLLARRRLVFEEFLKFFYAVRQQKQQRSRLLRKICLQTVPETDEILKYLPFELTAAQQRVWRQIQEDMTKQQAMARLVQGDVGSGKTIIAFLAMIMAACNGCQAALMVPTEILARQHFDSLQQILSHMSDPCKAVLLTGSMKAQEKRSARSLIESGEVSLVIGTHALIQEKVNYADLALVVTDEQHRFGVRQRQRLGDKGDLPHTIVMSATPIPRTLAVILYGDMDVSVIDELPADRLPVKNCVVGTGWRDRAYRFIAKEIAAGHQAYVVCPLVDASEMIDGENVCDYAQMLREKLDSSVQVGILHGKMKDEQKDAVMKEFLENRIQVLVATTVVEVGVNVPNATVMMIENAERFGLAQLHQLRGRIGRGKAQSYCIMVTSAEDETTKKRLDILAHSNDGFEIASKDLQLRGPGDLLGVRQSGEMQFALADIYSDADIMQSASQAADRIIDKNTSSSPGCYRMIEKYLTDLIDKSDGKMSI